ncbi:MAG TPA: FtsX-like permease family protein, partial [Limnochordia bacterium]
MLRTSFALALRELRAGARKLVGLLLAVALGVAALTAVKGFSDSLRAALAREQKALFGGDLRIVSERPLSAEQERRLREFAAADGAAWTAITEFVALAFVPQTDRLSVVEVKAVDPSTYPLYGRLSVEPASAYPEGLDAHSALAAPELLAKLDVEVGQSVEIGLSRFRIAGVIVSEPDRTLNVFPLGPRLFLSRAGLARLSLLGTGSPMSHTLLVRLGAGEADLAAARQRLRALFEGSRVRITDYRRAQARIDRLLRRVSGFLSLTALLALLVGGVAVAHAVRVFIQERMDAIAVMKCLGGTSFQLTAVYGLQVLLLGGAGAALGAALGYGMQAALPAAIGPLLNLSAPLRPSPLSAVQGMAVGLVVALLFAVGPLWQVRRLRPIVLWRREVAQGSEARAPIAERAAWIVGGGSLVWALAAWLAGSGRLAAAFLAGLAAAWSLLWVTARLLFWLVRRIPTGQSPVWRHGVQNVGRPGSQATLIVTGLGVGIAAVLAILLTQEGLLREL